MSNIKTSPFGMAVRPRLNVPDKKHNRAGVYHTRIRFSAEDAAPMIAEIDEARSLALEEAKRGATSDRIAARIRLAQPPYVLADDDSGEVEIKFRMKAIALARSGRPAKQSPAIFDANNKHSPQLEIGHGDTIRVSYSIGRYSTGIVGAGVTLDLRCVQVSKQANAAESFGFSDVEPLPASAQVAAAG